MVKKTTNKQTVLYIAEMPEMLPADATRKGRSSPLSWLKLRTPTLPIGVHSATAVPAAQRYNTQRQYVKMLPDGFAVVGVYDEIVIHFGGNRTAPLRGWLVNHAYQPATVAEIAAVIGLSDRKMLARALKELEQVGLLLRVVLPDMIEAIKWDRTVCPDEVKNAPAIELSDLDDSDDARQGEDEGNNDPDDSNDARQGENEGNNDPNDSDDARRGEDKGLAGDVSGHSPDTVQPPSGHRPATVRTGGG